MAGQPQQPISDTQTKIVEISKESGKNKRTYGAFPRLSLTKTLELAKKIYELGEGESRRRLTVFDKLGKSADSGRSRDLMIASNSGYGLTTGSYNSEYLSLTPRGLRIVSATDDGTKYEAIYEALFSNRIFDAFVTRFKDKSLPDDELAIDYLTRNQALSPIDAQACWSVFKDNLNDFNLVQTLSGKKVIVTREFALERLGIDPKPLTPDESPPPEPSSLIQPPVSPLATQPGDSPKPELPLPQFTFNIQIVLPENASQETYNNIFKSIAVYLLGRGEG